MSAVESRGGAGDGTVVTFELDGAAVTVRVAEGESLLESLRERLGVTTVKDACSPQGQCGACVVLVNGQAVTSCAMPATKVAGQRVVTHAGLPEAERTLYARAYAVSGAVQCGFCTPGFVLRTAALLARHPRPTRAELARGAGLHLCRCTGYTKILDAMELAASCRRGERELPPLPLDAGVGRSYPKHRAERYALGEEAYVDDLAVPGMLHGALRLCDHPRAVVRRIDTARAAALPGVACVLTAGDVVGARRYGLIEQDWPSFLAEGETSAMVGDVLAAVAAVDRRTARRAAALVEVEYEVLPPVTSARAALAADAPRVHAGRSNVLARTRYARGDVDAALAASAHVVRERFTTQCIEHLYLEPESCLVEPEAGGGVHVWSQGQGVYDDRRQLCRALDLADAAVRVTLVPNGGAFGGKEDLSVQVQAAMLALRTGRPVKLTLGRDESVRMHPKRHPFELAYEVGCDADGRLTALRATLVADTGAYASVGAKVVERAAGHACGPYRIPAVAVDALAVFTNNPPNGAMRGFGVNQAAFAVEQVVDMLGERCGLDPYQMRERNLLSDGDRFGPGQRMAHAAGLRRTLAAVKEVYYGAKVAGLACGIKNVGIGNGMTDVGRARIDLLPAGRVRLCHGMTEMGQGLHTVAIQIFCQETGLPWPADGTVEVSTDADLDCGMTTASRATVLVGNALVDAAKKLRQALAAEGGVLAALEGRSFRGEFACDWTVKPGAPGDERPTHLSFGFATQVVVLDEATGKIQKVVAAHDVGRALNPALVEGQIQGSVHMGLGYALSEELRLEGGHPVDATMRKLGVLRPHETPDIEVVLVEEPDPHGPHGARGVGEIGLVPTAPAVAAALHRFDGRRRTSLPMRDNYEKVRR
ncbi:MAG: selenium-dependent xanthine dehydrogenase [Polyangiaceae bacterium]|nr:selenium-dependent xanthine dehydrogenase [Polyangiaceae bacterium]